jgi:hypothetical protein
MTEKRLEYYGLIRIVPGEKELRTYLNQCAEYIDKRCFLPISAEIDEFISGRNVDEMNLEQLSSTLQYFNLLPDFLYSYKEIVWREEYYSNVSEFETSNGNLIVLEKLGGGVFEFANSTGTKIDCNFWDEIDEISWAESLAISHYEINTDDAILVWFIGRMPSWAIFVYDGFGFLLKDAGSSIKGKESPSLADDTILNEVSVFDLTCRIPNINDLRAYLFRALNANFGLSETIRGNLGINIGDPLKLEIDKIPDDELRMVLLGGDIYPKIVYFFRKKYDLLLKIHGRKEHEVLPYEYYPPLFTNIHEISFDDSGLIAMQFFSSQIYRLYSSSGNVITDYCHDLHLLTEGRFVTRSSGRSFGYFVNKYDSVKQKVNTLTTFGDYDHQHLFLPYLNNRDRISEMYYPNSGLWRQLNSFKLSNNEEELKLILSNTDIWTSSRKLVPLYAHNPNLALIVLNKNPVAFSLLSESLQNDIDFVLLALSNKCDVFNYLNESFRSNKEIVMKALKETSLEGEVVIMLPESIKGDRDLLLAAIAKTSNGQIFEFFPETYKNDRGFVLEAVKLKGMSLQYVNDNFKDDKELVLSAITNSGDAIQYASDNLKEDTDIVELSKKIMEEKKALDEEDDLPF